MKVVRCSGEGQGSCDFCDAYGIWNRHWMTSLYQIKDPTYYKCFEDFTLCYDCVAKTAAFFDDKVEIVGA